MGSKVNHVVMLPWLAFGHMLPFFHLSIALAKAGLRVSLISTPKNIQRLPQVPSNLSSLLKLVAFNLPKVEGLPEGAEATVDISVSQMAYLRIAYDLLRDQFKKFMDAESPDVIIQDFVPYWTTNMTEEFITTPRIMLSVFSGSTLAFLGPPEKQTMQAVKEKYPTPESMTVPPEWFNFPSTVAYRLSDANLIFAITKSQPKVPIAAEQEDRMTRAFKTCHAVAIRSCNEYEGEYLNLLNNMYEKPVIPFGLLPPAKPDTTKTQNHEIFNWLDKQKPKSVVYVAFGSEAKLKKEQVHAIAEGLEMAKIPFFWALRKPTWAENDDDSILPPGFRTRTESFGVVYLGWAPQLEILAHPSIGGSLFHSGWGSIIETLQHGHTPVILPLIFDQRLHGSLLVEKGLAVDVETREEDGSFDGKDIAKALTKAMIDEEGKEVRISANKMGTVFGNEELQYKHYLDRFINFVKTI